MLPVGRLLAGIIAGDDTGELFDGVCRALARRREVGEASKELKKNREGEVMGDMRKEMMKGGDISVSSS